LGNGWNLEKAHDRNRSSLSNTNNNLYITREQALVKGGSGSDLWVPLGTVVVVVVVVVVPTLF
jgi:hypothetical protein